MPGILLIINNWGSYIFRKLKNIYYFASNISQGALIAQLEQQATHSLEAPAAAAACRVEMLQILFHCLSPAS